MRNKKTFGDKRGQVTIFIILAIVIVAAIVLFFTLTDSGKKITKNLISGSEIDVRQELSSCISDNDKIKESINKVLLQGGTLEPKFYYAYQGNNIEYLCHTSSYYQTCYMQKPLVVNYVEDEMQKAIEPEIKGCVQALQASLTSKGYSLSNRNYNIDVNLVSENIKVDVDYDLTITKESSQRFEGFEVKIPSKSYELVSLSTSILNYEARYGDSDPLQYMILYPGTKVEKYKQGEGSTIYILTDRKTDEKFQFAVRSLAWPPGYGVAE